MPPSRPISRRRFLGSTLAASLVSLPARSEAPPPGEDGFRVLEARDGALRLLAEPAAETTVWGYDGQVPGPLLRVKKGEEVKVRLVNKLAQPTSLCWHGVRIANAMDGVAGLTQKPVPPDGSFDYRFTPPDSGLYWYHPHVLPWQAEQLGRGLYGVLIVDEPEPPRADRDMLVVLDDWKLDENAQIIGDFGAPADVLGAGRIGPLVAVNSRPAPITEILPPLSRVRLRILNAAIARVMLITFSGAKPWILAVDGQPCEAFEPVRRTIPIGPGARFDVMLDLPAEAGAEAILTLRGDNEPDRALLAFKTEGEPRALSPPIASLQQNPLLPAVIKLQAARKIDIVIEPVVKSGEAPITPASTRPLYWKLNGVASEGFGPTPLFSVKRGAPVTLGLINRTGFVQQIHVHGHHMRLLHDLDDGWEPYWRDAVLVPEGKTKHVAFVADNPGKWVIECLMAERQATGMATWFEVT
jgi:FtsP/CotA-like multicopper oxidase with cupredoxin domain